MTSNIQVDHIDAPAHWASYLINGDGSSLEATERAKCNEWVARLYRKGGWYVVSCAEDSYIGRFNGLLHELATYTLHRRTR